MAICLLFVGKHYFNLSKSLFAVIIILKAFSSICYTIHSLFAFTAGAVQMQMVRYVTVNVNVYVILVRWNTNAANFGRKIHEIYHFIELFAFKLVIGQLIFFLMVSGAYYGLFQS